jgi:hypothetical protein
VSKWVQRGLFHLNDDLLRDLARVTEKWFLEAFQRVRPGVIAAHGAAKFIDAAKTCQWAREPKVCTLA